MGGADRRERRIGLDVDIDAAVAAEYAVDLIADLLLELGGGTSRSSAPGR